MSAIDEFKPGKFSIPRRIGLGVLALLAIFTIMGSVKIVSTGNVGVSRTFGQIDRTERQAGINLKFPFITTISEYNVRETTLDLRDLTPKAKDNLSLKDLDVSIYYVVSPDKAADVVFDFQGQTEWNAQEGVWMPGSAMVYRYARGRFTTP